MERSGNYVLKAVVAAVLGLFLCSTAEAAPGRFNIKKTTESLSVRSSYSSTKVKLSSDTDCKIENSKKLIFDELEKNGIRETADNFEVGYQSKVLNRINGTATINLQLIQTHTLSKEKLPVADSKLNVSIKCSKKGMTLQRLDLKTFNISNVETLSAKNIADGQELSAAIGSDFSYHYLRYYPDSGWKEELSIVDSADDSRLAILSGKSSISYFETAHQHLTLEGQIYGKGNAYGPSWGEPQDLLPIIKYYIRDEGWQTFSQTDMNGEFSTDITGPIGYVTGALGNQDTSMFEELVTVTASDWSGFYCPADTTGDGSYVSAGAGCKWTATEPAAGIKRIDLVYNLMPPAEEGYPDQVVATEESIAVVNGHYHLNKAYQWTIDSLAPGSEFAFNPVKAEVSDTSVVGPCNANYSPTANKISTPPAGQGTLPDGRTADCVNMAFESVLYHEFGHAVDDMASQHSVPPLFRSSDDEPAGLGEGWGDIFASFQTNDSRIGRYLVPDIYFPMNYIREIDGEYQYADVAPASQGEPLEDIYEYGKVWAAFAWHLRQLLMIQYGDAQGDLVARDLIMGSLAADPQDMLEAFRDLILHDDEDDDITNCTTHANIILAMAIRHGIPWETIPELAGLDYPTCGGDTLVLPVLEVGYSKSNYESIQLTSDGGAILAGYVSDNGGQNEQNLVFTKVDQYGLKVWRQEIDYYTDHDDRVKAMTIDPLGRLVLASSVGNPVNNPGFGTWFPRYNAQTGEFYYSDQMVFGFGAIDNQGQSVGGRPIDSSNAISTLTDPATGVHTGYATAGVTQSFAEHSNLCFTEGEHGFDIKCADGFIGYLPVDGFTGNINPPTPEHPEPNPNETIRAYGGTATDAFRDIAQDYEGDLVAVGYSTSTAFTLPGGATQSITLQGHNAVVIKSDTLGNPLVSSAQIYGGNGRDGLGSIRPVAGAGPSGQDGYIAVGSTDSDIDNPQGGLEIYIVRMNDDLSEGWQKTFGFATNDSGRAVRPLPGVGNGFAVLAGIGSTSEDYDDYTGSVLFELSDDGGTITRCQIFEKKHFDKFEIAADGSYYLAGRWGSFKYGDALAFKVDQLPAGDCGLQ